MPNVKKALNASQSKEPIRGSYVRTVTARVMSVEFNQSTGQTWVKLGAKIDGKPVYWSLPGQFIHDVGENVTLGINAKGYADLLGGQEDELPEN